MWSLNEAVVVVPVRLLLEGVANVAARVVMTTGAQRILSVELRPDNRIFFLRYSRNFTYNRLNNLN